MVIEVTCSKDGGSTTSNDLNAEDSVNHYSAGAIWNGDWRKGRILQGYFGNELKPRHYAISMGRQSPKYIYANALSFFPLTSHPYEDSDYLLKLPAGVMDFLPLDTYVMPIRMLMTEGQLECWAEANYMADMPEEYTKAIKEAWVKRVRSFKMEDN